MLAFFEFTTGAPHSLASKHVVWLSESQPDYIPYIEMDFLGDYILVSQQELPDEEDPPLDKLVPRALRLVSWKTGDVTYVSDVIAFLSCIHNALMKLLSYADSWTTSNQYQEWVISRWSLTRTIT